MALTPILHFSLPLPAMYFPANFEQKLGFDVIRQILGDHCLSSLGRNRVGKIAFSTDADEIHRWLDQTAELKQILQFEERFPSQDYYDLVPELLRIRIPGTYLETEQLSELKLSVFTISSLLTFISEKREKYPTLYQMTGSGPGSPSEVELLTVIPILKGLIGQVDKIVDDKSEIRDAASPELNRIRKEKKSLQIGRAHV